MGSDGGFVVAWGDSARDGSFTGVFGQRFDSAGGSLGTDFQVNTTTLQAQAAPDVPGDEIIYFAVVSMGTPGSPVATSAWSSAPVPSTRTAVMPGAFGRLRTYR